MKLIFVSDNGRHHKKVNFNALSLFFSFMALVLCVSAIVSIIDTHRKKAISTSEIKLLDKFDSVLSKAAKLEGQVKRLNSLGEIIADKNKIDIETYLLAKAPAMGGLGHTSNSRSIVMSKNNLIKSIDDLELELELQEQRYAILNKSSINKKLTPSQNTQNKTDKIDYTMPVFTGYISSPYGKRRDPFNGHQRHHNGIDIAAKQGSKIKTIASGFVTFAGRKGGYGNVIDVHHSDSMKSRYAHLDKIKVKKGDVVRKGDIIATMGKTGRATGPHLHLEVWKNNRPVNPEAFIDTALIK